MPNDDVTLADFTVSADFDLDEVEATTRRFGAAVVPGYLEPIALQRLRGEFDGLFEDESDYVYRIGYGPGRAVSLVNNAAFKSRYPHVGKFFDDPKMLDLARRYVGFPCLPNHEIYATHEYVPDAPVAPTHFDKLWTLKFMLYLEDVDVDTAPFGVVPGSASQNREVFRDIFEDNQIQLLTMNDARYQQMRNEDPARDPEVIDITGPAGTLIVFDSDTFHHAAPVKTGRERKVLRAHSGPYASYAAVKKYSRQWWRGEKPYSRFDALKDKLMARAP